MAGGGVALNQMFENQGGPSPLKYGTGGRITGFDKGEIKDLARFGRNGDTMLAHINPQEAQMLKRMGGSGTINPITGLPQFDVDDDVISSVSLEGGGDFGGGDGGGYSDTSEQVQDFQNTGYDYSSDISGSMAGDNSLNSDKNTYVNNNTSTNSGTDTLDAFLTLNNNFDDDIDDVVNTPGPVSTGLDDQVTDIVYTPGPVVTETDDISEIIITTDRPTQTPFDTLTLTDTVTYFTETDSEEISEIIITTDRPTKTPVVTDTEDISEIIITTDRPTKTPVVTATETDTDEISEIIITTDRPTPTPTVTITLTVTDTDTVTYVTETDTEEVSEIIITTDRPTPTPTVTVTFTFTDTDTVTFVTETDTEDPTETIIITDRPTPTPTVTQTPRPTTTPVPTNTPVPRQGIYRSQYQNYANPLTMFNASNYGQDVPTSAGYNYASSRQGIGALNQNLRDMADRQMAQTYPDGSPKGADMNAVLREMRAAGLTPTDLENAYYGRTTGLNTPFSVYSKTPPMQTPFSFTDVPQPKPQTPEQKQIAMSNGIFDLIKKLPK